MKRTVWIGLCVIPIALVGGAFWARKAAWERMEDTYRRELVTHAVRYSGLQGVGVVFSHREREGRREQMHILTGWDRGELQTAVADLHLLRRAPGVWRIEDGNYLQFVGPPYVFIVSLDQDRGEFLQAGNRSSDELRTISLSPEFCRMLKKRVWAQCSDKLRSFHISQPR